MHCRRVVITRPGGPDVLRMITDPLPEPGPGEVCVKVLAAGVARADIMMRRGQYPGEVPPYPYAPGYDIAGEVHSLGEDVQGLEVGQLVAALTGVGGYAEYLCVPAAWLVPVPHGLDPAEVVSLVLNYLTAYQMMHRFASVREGERILVHAAASGVGTALLQLGRLLDLRMWGTASAGKHPVVESLGAIPIDYRSEDFVRRVRREADGRGASLAVVSCAAARGAPHRLRGDGINGPGKTRVEREGAARLSPQGVELSPWWKKRAMVRSLR